MHCPLGKICGEGTSSAQVSKKMAKDGHGIGVAKSE